MNKHSLKNLEHVKVPEGNFASSNSMNISFVTSLFLNTEINYKLILSKDDKGI